MATRKMWFKLRRYGWGWVPAAWQGWATVLGFILYIIVGSRLLILDEPEAYGPILAYFGWIAFGVVILLTVSYRYGPKPSWH